MFEPLSAFCPGCDKLDHGLLYECIPHHTYGRLVRPHQAEKLVMLTHSLKLDQSTEAVKTQSLKAKSVIELSLNTKTVFLLCCV